MPRLAQNRLVMILVGLAGMVLVVAPSVINGRIPGDLGDARFNSYVLEHFHRWITQQDHSFWNADFFYPFPLTIAFSDNHLGNGFIYSLFRAVGFDRGDAFRLWFAVGFAINFAAAGYSLVRLGYSRLAAALGAFLFAFGLPITTQEGHAQLVYRFGVPLALLALVEFRRNKQLLQLGLVAFWTTWQFYCSIYIGYFLTLLLVAVVLGQALCRDAAPGASILPLDAYRVWKRSPVRTRFAFLAAMAVLAGLMAVLCAPYVEASHLYGFHRTWPEIASMLPRPMSYVLANNSLIWPSTGLLFDALPMRHEHAMFIGIAPFLAIAAAVILRFAGRATLDSLFVPVGLAILLLVLLTIMVHGYSPYRLLAALPGSDAIRAVTRIGTVLLFPFGVLLAASLDAIMTARLPGWMRSSIIALVAALLVVEACFIRHTTATEDAWRARMAAVAAKLPASVSESPILLLGPVPGEPSFLAELDAMLFAQDRGWRTLNGYSGNQPPGHKLSGLCQDAPRDLALGLKFLGLNSEQDYAKLARQVVAVGYPPCDQAEQLRRPPLSLFAGPVPAELMANVRLRIERLALRDGKVLIEAAITNGASIALPADSLTGTPIRLSACYVAAHGTASCPIWDSRQDLAVDVPPGATQRVEIPYPAPAAPGTYRVALSMVQDGVAWFHDRGMPVPVSAQTITVEQSAHLSEGDSAAGAGAN